MVERQRLTKRGGQTKTQGIETGTNRERQSKTQGKETETDRERRRETDRERQRETDKEGQREGQPNETNRQIQKHKESGPE